jgi:hypothetical protein
MRVEGAKMNGRNYMSNVTMIEQIQRDALNADVPVSTLLLKVKLAAAKLGLPKLEGWVDKELKGYNQQDETPEYRRLQGVPGARGPYRGWEPLVTDKDFAERFSTAHIGTPISGIESQIRSAPKAPLIYQYPPAVAEGLNKSNRGQISQCGVLFNAQQLVPIVEVVRTLVLEWSIEMERAGITGSSDTSFSEEEKNRAQSTPVTIHIGQIGTFTGNLGVGNTAADVTSSSLRVESVENLLNQIKAHSATLSAEGLDEDDLLHRVATIENEVKKPAPNHGVIKSLLEDLRTVVRASVQGLVSTGLLSLLNQILGTGVPTV